MTDIAEPNGVPDDALSAPSDVAQDLAGAPVDGELADVTVIAEAVADADLGSASGVDTVLAQHAPDVDGAPVVGDEDEDEDEDEDGSVVGDEDGSVVAGDAGDAGGEGDGGAARKRRRRGSRGGRGRTRKPSADEADPDGIGPDGVGPGIDGAGEGVAADEDDSGQTVPSTAPQPLRSRRPQIGDTRPAAAAVAAAATPLPTPRVGGGQGGGGGRGGGAAGGGGGGGASGAAPATASPSGEGRKRRRRGGRGRGDGSGANGGGNGGGGNGGGNGGGGSPAAVRPRPERQPVEMEIGGNVAERDAETLERRRGRERKGRPVGRYLMVVHKMPQATQIAILEGRVLIEHYVSRPQDDANQIDGNIYLGRVQNVLPGMEAAFIDIGTPKNAVLYRGDVRFDIDDVEGATASRNTARIEELLRPGQNVICQVTKNPIAHKGARLTQEVSLPGRFVVFVPNSATYGISKRLSDDERKRLRRILDDVKPANHGLIVRTAAEGASADELSRDVARLASQWERIDALAKSTSRPGLLYREPDLAVRVIREEFNKEYRGVVIDDPDLYADVRDYVASISPELADRVELYDTAEELLPIFERHHVHEQLHKAIDRKVWLASGGSLIIERTEALTVIDVNTGKNVGTSNLEETVYRNNLEAADEIARQLRLRDIGGIIVIDFIDMEVASNRHDVSRAFREALARDKTRTQVFEISELGLVEMTRKRVSEGLVESLSTSCPTCEGRGMIFDQSLVD